MFDDATLTLGAVKSSCSTLQRNTQDIRIQGVSGLGTTGKFRHTFIENRTPSQVLDYTTESDKVGQ